MQQLNTNEIITRYQMEAKILLPATDLLQNVALLLAEETDVQRLSIFHRSLNVRSSLIDNVNVKVD